MQPDVQEPIAEISGESITDETETTDEEAEAEEEPTETEEVEETAFVELLSVDDTLEITQNGSRLFVNAAGGIQWQRSADDTNYEDIANAVGDFYDLTADDSTKYLRVVVDGDTASPSIQIGTCFRQGF